MSLSCYYLILLTALISAVASASSSSTNSVAFLISGAGSAHQTEHNDQHHNFHRPTLFRSQSSRRTDRNNEQRALFRRSSWKDYERRLHTILGSSSSTSSTSSSADGDTSTAVSESSPSTAEHGQAKDDQHEEEAALMNQSRRNRAYLSTLSLNLNSALDSYLQTHRDGDVRRAQNILRQMERECLVENADLLEEARATCQEAGLDVNLDNEEVSIGTFDDHDERSAGSANKEAEARSSSSGGDNKEKEEKTLHIDSDTAKRKAEADARRKWEATRPGGISPGMNTVHPGEYTTTNRMQSRANGGGGRLGNSNSNSQGVSGSMAEGVRSGLQQQPVESPMGASRDKRAQGGRSILSTRSPTDAAMLGGLDDRLTNQGANSGGEPKKTSFPGNVVATGGKTSLTSRNSSSDPAAAANDIQDFRGSMASSSASTVSDDSSQPGDSSPASAATQSGEEQASALVAGAGSGDAFRGTTLGIGGLDDVLNQIKRRVWVPLAAPPSLLAELGISPVRGLLLYGLPGCGKTLLARSLGRILSPARPITVVSGPEIMDRFVGSSEANLREIFDNPPPIYDSYRVNYADMGAALEKSALHVVVLDEFDAIARSRGGGDGKGSQGDAGVARDSVVNQMLAKMDGVDPLPVPTLVIGLTNKRTLIDPALLRPGRFEVQIEVPKPKSKEQRISILKVHLNSMMSSGRILVSDPPAGTAAARVLESGTLGAEDVQRLLTFDQLVDLLAVESEGFTGASLAAVARAAASHALERAVFDIQEGVSIADCLVTQEDFESSIDDVIESASEGDGGEDDSKTDEQTESSSPSEALHVDDNTSNT